MNWILLANTGYQPIADYYTLGVTLIAILVIIAGIRGIISVSRKEEDEVNVRIIRGSRKKEDESDV